MNEAETRAEHIDSALAYAGWGVVEGSMAVIWPAPFAEVREASPGDFRSNKDGWGEYLLKRLLADHKAKSQILSTTQQHRSKTEVTNSE